jgi:opacity protein-like surface antigen
MRALPLILLLVAAPVGASDDDAAALSLADKSPTTTQAASDWRVFTEATGSESTLRASAASERDAHLFFDVHYDHSFSRDWRAVFADLLDVHWTDSISHQNTLNTVIDAYLSWQPRTDAIVDLGRINTRYGVAFGYNPTDYFRANAIRSVISIDPTSLRENRLGSVMVRGQTLWTAGSLTALYSPKLADQQNSSAFSPDFGATNFRDRWLLAASHEVAKNFNPQFLVFGSAGHSPQLGVNLTTLLNDATVAYVEYSGGRAPTLLSRALMRPPDHAFRSQLGVGLTYTTASNLSLTAEYEYNGAGLDRSGWDALRSGPPAAYAQYRAFAAALQEPPTTRRLFLNARWQDALLNHLDLTAFAYYNVIDSSRQFWVETRYHWTHVDAALQWQVNSGAPGSEYGALPARQTWQALVTYFF